MADITFSGTIKCVRCGKPPARRDNELCPDCIERLQGQDTQPEPDVVERCTAWCSDGRTEHIAARHVRALLLRLAKAEREARRLRAALDRLDPMGGE